MLDLGLLGLTNPWLLIALVSIFVIAASLLYKRTLVSRN